MWITTDQAAEMHARFYRARYGAKAKAIVEAKAAKLRTSGDIDGERIWTDVKRQLETQDTH